MLVAQDLANSKNVFLDEFRIYVGLRPQGFQKFILCHQASRMFNQVTQYIEGLRCKRYPVLAAPETLIPGIKPESSEQLHAAPSWSYAINTPAEYERILRHYKRRFHMFR